MFWIPNGAYPAGRFGIRESARNVDADEGAVEHVHAAPMEI